MYGGPMVLVGIIVLLRVYPRVYGGTGTPVPAAISPNGLSPRVRGNPSGTHATQASQGSIPACTGEPQKYLDGRRITRSIPACTGEPAAPRPASSRRAVYPRVYGGTGPPVLGLSLSHGLSPRVRGNHYSECSALDVLGLSPRVRGNRQRFYTRLQRYRSIPACTGEPFLVLLCCVLRPVYPRVYGGTASPIKRDDWDIGLSPRVRGNRFSY